MPLPQDVYYALTGQPIYAGRPTPNLLPTFDSLTFTNYTGAPWDQQDGKVMVVELHGSSGSNNSVGRQYRAQVSGYMAFEGFTEFSFSLGAGWDGTNYMVMLRPIDRWGTRESMHIGFLRADGKIHLISERRYDTMLRWADTNLTLYNLNKRLLTGGSMGGWGSISYGVRRYDEFAAIYPDRPRWRYDHIVGHVAVANWETNGVDSYLVANLPPLAPEDGGGSYSDHTDMIAYIANTSNKVRWIGWCCGRNDGFATFSDQVAAVVALRAAKRGFAFAWNDGNHGTGSIMNQITQSYPFGTFSRDKGYPLFTDHSGDQDPAVDLVGGINIGLSFRNVVESTNGWSCEVTHVLAACTVKVEPKSDIFLASVAKQTITIPAANTWVAVSFTV